MENNNMHDMYAEEHRLRTFASWPANPPIDPLALARNGFFATGNTYEVECNWCCRRINDWRIGDQAEERHRRMEPLCDIIVNPQACGNIPLECNSVDLSGQAACSSNSNSRNVPDLYVESNRLATFKNWPNPNISPIALAKAGFFYLNRSDEVKCAWCKGVIAKWEKQDNAFEEHRRFFPDCPRVQLGPLIEIASDGIRDLGIQQITPPTKPKFSSLDARLRTYTNWPISDVQRPEALAQAGLYYQNVDDHVRCFHCNIGLRSWQKEDDAWFEHAKWYPKCQFVRLVKGVAYVQQVQDMTRATTIEEAMSTSPVLQALEIGIDGGSIRNATLRQLLISGRPYSTVEDLLKAVFGDRDDDDEDEPIGDATPLQEGVAEGQSQSGAGACIVREVSRLVNSIFGAGEGEQNPAIEHITIPAAPEPEGINCREALRSTSTAQVVTAVAESEMSAECATASAALESANVPVSALAVEDCRPPTTRKMSLEEENRKLKDARLCKICLDEEVGVVFLPCGHLVTCVQCAPGVNQCPMCRTDIKGFVRTFLS